MPLKSKLDWPSIRHDYESGMAKSQCMDKYGFGEKPWYLAIKRGDITPLRHRPPTGKRTITDPMQCAKCDAVKPLSEFNFSKNKNRHYYHCKKCQNAYVRSHYQRNRQYYIHKGMVNSDAAKTISYEFLRKYFTDHPCIDCGEKNPIVLQFDHVRGKKYRAISTMISRGCSLARIQTEIEKCDVRCANCHFIKTAKEHNWKWVKFLEDKGL